VFYGAAALFVFIECAARCYLARLAKGLSMLKQVRTERPGLGGKCIYGAIAVLVSSRPRSSEISVGVRLKLEKGRWDRWSEPRQVAILHLE